MYRAGLFLGENQASQHKQEQQHGGMKGSRVDPSMGGLPLTASPPQPIYAATWSSTTTTTMASALLRRQLALPKPALFRSFSTSTARWNPDVQSTTKSPFDTHTVEDLHGMSAAEILAETGTRADAKLRHFTGAFCDFSPCC